jgi:hypothetical protein
MGVRPKLRLTLAPACVQRQAVQHPHAQSAGLRMRELGADSAAPPTAEYVPQPLRARDGSSARPQRTSLSGTNDHPAPFVKRPALAPIYTALGLTSLDQAISNRKLRWAGHVRRMDWSRLPRKLTSWVDAPRCRGRAHCYGHGLMRELQLIGFNTDRVAVHACTVQLGVSPSWPLGGRRSRQREVAQAAARLPLAGGSARGNERAIRRRNPSVTCSDSVTHCNCNMLQLQ